MLSAETAIGAYPVKTVSALRGVTTEAEEWVREEAKEQIALPIINTDLEGLVREQVWRVDVVLSSFVLFYVVWCHAVFCRILLCCAVGSYCVQCYYVAICGNTV